MAAVAIELAPDLSAADRERALRLGPARVEGPKALEELVLEVGLVVRTVESWDAELRDTLVHTLRVLAANEAELRAAEGDDTFEEERAKKERLLEGVEAGLLRRTLVVAERRRARDAPAETGSQAK
jgi:hypothetical protein